MKKQLGRSLSRLTAMLLALMLLGICAAGAEIPQKDYSQRIALSVATVGFKDGFDYNAANEYYKWWTDTFNIEWDITSLTIDSWSTRLQTWINADDLPDWSVWRFNAEEAVNYAEQELVKKLPDDWKVKYPNLANAMALTPMNAYYEELLGGVYYIFRPIFAGHFPEEAEVVTPQMSVFLRADWAKQAGYDLARNIETKAITLTELIAYLQAVKDAGLTEYPFYGNSQGLCFAVDMTSDASGVTQSAYYLAEDGQYHWGPSDANSGVKEALRKIDTAYDRGLIYPEFYALKGGDDLGYFRSAGKAAAIIAPATVNVVKGCADYFASDLGLDFERDAAVLVLTDDEGIVHNKPELNYSQCNIISPGISDEALERLLTIWDYSCTEEAQMFIRMGFQDVDWKYDEEGNIINLLADTQTPNAAAKYTTMSPIYDNMIILPDDFALINPSISKDARDCVSQLYITRSKITSLRDAAVDWNLLSYSSQKMNVASMIYYDEYANIITRDGSFDAFYDAWVSDKLPLITPVIEELNEAFVKK